MSEETFFVKVVASLRRIWGTIAATALDWVKSPAAVFFTFIYPIVMILLFGYIFGASSGDGTMYNLYYLNEDVYIVDDTAYSYNPASLLIEQLQDESTINLIETNLNTTAIAPDVWMKSEDVPYMFVIPKGWSQGVNDSKIDPNNPRVNIDYYYDPGYTSAQEVAAIIDTVLVEMNAEEFGIPTSVMIDVQATPERQGLSYIDFYVPGMIMVTLSTSGMMGMVSIVTEGRNSGLIFKISSSPIKKWEWALGQEIWQVVIAFAISFLTILTGCLAFGFNLGTLHPLMIVVLIFGTMTFAGLALIIARFVKRPEAAMAATMSFVFPQMFLSGTIMPLEIMPDFMRVIAQFFPLYYISQASSALQLEATFNDAWFYIGVVAAMGIVFFIVGTILSVWRKE